MLGLCRESRGCKQQELRVDNKVFGFVGFKWENIKNFDSDSKFKNKNENQYL